MSIGIDILIPAVLPAVVDAIKNAITRLTGGPKPANIDEQIKLENAQIERLKALAAIDAPVGTPSQWVVDLRASFRYLACAGMILAALATLVIPASVTLVDLAWQAAGYASSFLFGERMLFNLKQGKDK